MCVAKSAADAGDEEGDVTLLKAYVEFEEVSQVAAQFEVEYHVAGDEVLERQVQWNNKRMIQSLQGTQLVLQHLSTRRMLFTQTEHLSLVCLSNIHGSVIPLTVHFYEFPLLRSI